MLIRGGKRAGAGRKKAAKTLITKDFALQILSGIDINSKWNEFLNSKDQKVALEAAKYLSNRAFGMPQSNVQLSGDSENPIKLLVEIVGKSVQKVPVE